MTMYEQYLNDEILDLFFKRDVDKEIIDLLFKDEEMLEAMNNNYDDFDYNKPTTCISRDFI